MKPAGYSKESLKLSEQNRQMVLDWLWANGNATFAAMFASLEEQAKADGREINGQSLRGAMINMVHKGEVAATGPRKKRVFIPIARVTESADAMLERKQQRHKKWCENRGGDRRSAKAKDAVVDPEEARRARLKAEAARRGVTIHFAGDTPQSRESRGQGAVRERVYINCAMPI